MEEKVKRESRKCVESLFKKKDGRGCGCISMDSMRSIMHTIIHNFSCEEELEAVMAQHIKLQKYTTLDPLTRKMEVKYLSDAIDFPSTLAIAVHFLKKVERRESDAFAGKGLIRYTDLPISEVGHVKSRADAKRRLY